MFFYLSRYPSVYLRLASEIRRTFSSGRDIEVGVLLSKCKYLRAVIDESMRMSPPFLGTFWREPYDSFKDLFIVDGQIIPRGTMVGVNPYCIMHNEEYFPRPHFFDPERWLEPDEDKPEDPYGKERRTMMRAGFAPFALGETGCLGKAMAYHEISLVIAKTLWYFDFHRAPGEAGRLGEGVPGSTDGRHLKGEYQLYDLSVADHHGPLLQFIPRGDLGDELRESPQGSYGPD